jgi:hypothetical protein
MFCPKCATQNADDARFCRSCGTDISLVPQAVTGHLATRLADEDEGRRSRRHRRRQADKGPPSIERAVKNLFMGFAFIGVAFAALAWGPGGHVWWFWMFLPAASLLADGVSTWVRVNDERRRLAPPAYRPAQTPFEPQPGVGTLPPRETGEMRPPPSVTEATTRHLGMTPERKRGDV